MCLFSTTRKPYARPVNDPPPHRSYYSAHPDGLNAHELTLPEESFRRHSGHHHHHHHHRPPSREFIVRNDDHRRSSREVREYDIYRRSGASLPAVDYPRRSGGSVGLPGGYYKKETRYVREG